MHPLPTWQLFLCESKQNKSVPIPAVALLLFQRSSRDEVTASTYIRSSSVRMEKRPSICKSNANPREALGMHTLSFMKLSKKRAHYFYRNDAPRWESTSTESLWFSLRYVVPPENLNKHMENHKDISGSLCGKHFFLLLPFSKCLCYCTLACILKMQDMGNEKGKGWNTQQPSEGKRSVEKFSANNMPM